MGLKATVSSSAFPPVSLSVCASRGLPPWAHGANPIYSAHQFNSFNIRMGWMDEAERFAAAREGGEAVVSSGRQPSHAGQSRKKSFKTLKAEACLLPTHTNTQSRQHMYSPLHTPAVSLWHTTVWSFLWSLSQCWCWSVVVWWN